MRIYLDDDSVPELLIKLLRRAGHDVQTPADCRLVGRSDAVHLTHAIRDDRVLLSRNHQDFEDLHDVLKIAGGHHHGMLFVRSDNNPARDLSYRGIVTAIGKIITSGLIFQNEWFVLNHWR